MLLPVNVRLWDVRFDRPEVRLIRGPDGCDREYKTKKHHFATVAAETLVDAASSVLSEWPDAIIWQINNHGRDNYILVQDEKQ